MSKACVIFNYVLLVQLCYKFNRLLLHGVITGCISKTCAFSMRNCYLSLAFLALFVNPLVAEMQLRSADVLQNGAGMSDSPELYAVFAGKYGFNVEPTGSLFVLDKKTGESITAELGNE